MKTIRNLCLVSFLFCLVACDIDEQQELKPAYCPSRIMVGMPQEMEQLIYIDETESRVLPLLVNQTVQMTCSMEPDSVTFKQVIWSSSNENVVSVTQDGLVTALAEEGAAYSVISAAPVGMFSGSGVVSSIKVKVSASMVQASSMTVTATKDSIYVGETSQLTTSILPANTTYRTVSWTSSDESIATVDNKGVVTGVNVPENASTKVTITAHALDGSGVTADYELTILRIVDPTSVTIDPVYAKTNYACCITEKSLLLKYSTIPADATQSRITWTSSKPEIATVENGRLIYNTDGHFGEFTITATCPNGETSSIDMNMPVGLIRELFDDPNNITWRDAAQTGNSTSTSYVWNKDSTITITTYTQTVGTKQRADIKCFATPIYICPAAYPIIAIRMEDVKDKYATDGVTARNINLDTSGNDESDGTKFSGNVGGNNNKYVYDLKCSDGSHVFVYDLANQDFVTGGRFPADHIGKFGTFQFKHADIATIDHQITFTLYWVQSFPSLQDLKNYLTSEGLTWE